MNNVSSMQHGSKHCSGLFQMPSNTVEHRGVSPGQCGNRRLQDIYVISPFFSSFFFFACISADREPASPLPLSHVVSCVPLSARSQPLYRCTRGAVYNAAINGRRRVLTTRTRSPLSLSPFPLASRPPPPLPPLGFFSK